MEQNKNITPEAIEAANDAELTLVSAQAITITDDQGWQIAANELGIVKGKLKELTAKRKGITDPMHAAKTAVMDFFRGPTTYLEDAERAIKLSMINYTKEQQRIADEAQREHEEKERLRQAEIKRQQDEQVAAALALAEEAEAAGDAEGAAAMLEEAVAPVTETPPPAPAPIRSAPKAEGVTQRDNWKGRVTDPMALIKAVAEGRAPMNMLQSNQSAIGQMAKATKGSVQHDGVEYYNDPIISSRAS